MMRPNIVASSVEYEKAKFAEFLKIQADGLQHTRKWLLKHFKRPNDDTRWDPNDMKQRTFCLLAMAYLDLLEWDFHPDAEVSKINNYPEEYFFLWLEIIILKINFIFRL